MAEEKQVNDQVTDASVTSNLKVVADAPAIAMGNLYEATTNAQAVLNNNAVVAQQQNAVVAQAATTLAVTFLLSGGSVNDAHLAAVTAQSSKTKKD